jgi:hypothetical protein
MSERIQEAEVNPKYSYLVEDIVRDKESDGKLNYFAPSNSTSYDIILGKLRGRENSLKKNIKDNQSRMDQVIDDLNHKNSKGLTRKEVSSLEAECLSLQENYVNMKSSLNDISHLINKCEINQYAETQYMTRMKILRDKYLYDTDLIFLEKGVSWVVEYTDKMRIPIDLDSLPKF